MERDALRQWFQTFGGMRIKPDTGSFARNRERPPDRDGGLVNPYWTLKDSPTRRPFHLDRELSAFVSKARNKKAEKAAGDSIPDSLIGDLESLLREHGIGFD